MAGRVVYFTLQQGQVELAPGKLYRWFTTDQGEVALSFLDSGRWNEIMLGPSYKGYVPEAAYIVTDRDCAHTGRFQAEEPTEGLPSAESIVPTRLVPLRPRK